MASDYSKLVEALRYCVNARDCKKCAYRINNNSVKCRIQRVENAAAAIEALQDEVKRLNMRCADCEYAASEWPEDPEHTKTPKRGEWIEENRRPRSSQFVCSECHRTAYDPQPTRDKAWKKRCRYAYCPNCGADMRKMEVQDGQK